jgi:hypothetical protein
MFMTRASRDDQAAYRVGDSCLDIVTPMTRTSRSWSSSASVTWHGHRHGADAAVQPRVLDRVTGYLFAYWSLAAAGRDAPYTHP